MVNYLDNASKMNIVCQIAYYVLKAELIINQPYALHVIKVSLSAMVEL